MKINCFNLLGHCQPIQVRVKTRDINTVRWIRKLIDRKSKLF